MEKDKNKYCVISLTHVEALKNKTKKQASHRYREQTGGC